MSANISINETVYQGIMNYLDSEENYNRLVTYNNQVENGIDQRDDDYIENLLNNEDSFNFSLHTNSDDREFLDNISNNSEPTTDYSNELDQSDEDFIDSL